MSADSREAARLHDELRDLKEANRSLSVALRATIPATIIAAEMLHAVGKTEAAGKCFTVARTAEKILIEAGR